MKKNVGSQVIGVQMVNASDGSAFTGTATVVITGDGGTQGASGGTGPTHEGNGYHTYIPTQAETNYDLIAFTFTGSGAVPVTVQVFTTYPQTGDSYLAIGTDGTGLTEAGGTGDHLTALATAAALTTAQNDLDTLTGSDGVTLATTQGNYAPAKAGDAMALTSGERTTLAGVIWDSLTSGMVTVGSIGKKLADWSIHSAADVWSVATRVLTANTNLNDPTAASIADAVWDEARSGHVTAGTFGEGVKVESLNTQAKADVNAEADTALSDYGANTTTPPTAASIADAVWDEPVAGHVSAGTFGKTDADILADTNELQADWANGGRLDLLIDSIITALTGTLAEASSVPAANASLQAKVNWLFMWSRNKLTQTATTTTVYADDGSTSVATATVSDDGTTYTRGELT